jgi:hypothetical protein
VAIDRQLPLLRHREDDNKVKKARRGKPVRVLLMDMPRLLSDMIRGIISSGDSMSVVRAGVPQDAVLGAASKMRADVVIVGNADMSTEHCCELLYRRPRLKIIAISTDGRDGLVYELHPRVQAIGDISADSLIAAIKSATSVASKPVPQQ